MLPPMGQESEAEALFERIFEAASGERELELERVCAARPELAGRLRQMYARLASYGLIEPDDAAELRSAGLGPGSRVGGYEIESALGHGGMGMVFSARQVELGRRVALKLVRTDRMAEPRARLRFIREARLASALDHPNICSVVELGNDDGLLFLAMQFVEGRSLQELFAEARDGHPGLPWAEGSGSATRGKRWQPAVEMVQVLARALHHAHRQRLVHRDVKPANVIVRPDGQPVLLDFGLATELDSQTGITLSGDIVGTFAYMAPEQAAQRPCDARTDVHGLGVLLFECLTLRPPRAEVTAQGFLAALREPAVPLLSVDRTLPKDLGVVVDTALDTDPGRRYASAEAFAEDLRRVLAGEPIVARRPSWSSRALRWTTRHPMAATALLLLVLGLGSTLLLLDRQRQLTGDVQWRALVAAAEELQEREPLLALVSSLLALELDRNAETLAQTQRSARLQRDDGVYRTPELDQTCKWVGFAGGRVAHAMSLLGGVEDDEALQWQEPELGVKQAAAGRTEDGGRIVALVRGDGHLGLWRPGEAPRWIPLPVDVGALESPVRDVVVRPDGRQVAVLLRDGEQVVLVDCESGSLGRRELEHGDCRRLVYRNDGVLVTGHGNGSLRVEGGSGEAWVPGRFGAQSHAVTALAAVGPTHIVAGYERGWLARWSAEEHWCQLVHTRDVTTVAADPKGAVRGVRLQVRLGDANSAVERA